MPKLGFVTITVKTDDLDRLLSAATDILKGSPVKVEDMEPAKQLRLLLDEHENALTKEKKT